MSIKISLSSSVRRPGAFNELHYTDSGRALTPLQARIAVVAPKTSGGSASDVTPFQVFEAADADDKAGIGSPLALGLRAALAQAKFQGSAPEIWGCAIATPGSGTAHAKTLTVSGPAPEDGNLVIRVAGRTFTIGVSDGDTADDVAAAIEDALDAAVNILPVTASVASNVVTATHTVKGENGQDVAYEVVEAPAGIGVVLANGASGAGTVDITAAIDALVDQDYDFIAIENHKAADVTDATAHTAAQWAEGEERFRWIIIPCRDSLATANALSAAADDETIIVASCEATPSLPVEISAAVAVALAGKEAPNANYDGFELDLYAPAAASVYTTAEVESALAAGTTPLGKTSDGRLRIIRLTTTKTTDNSAPFEPLRELATSRTAAYTARQISAGYSRGFTGDNAVSMTDANLDRVRDMIVAVLRAEEELGYIEDVEALLPQTLVAEDPITPGRAAAGVELHVVSPLHQLVTSITAALS